MLVFIPEAIPQTDVIPPDYQTSQGTLEFLPGEQTKEIAVEIIDDIYREDKESFFVDLYKPINGNLDRDRAVGTIIDKHDLTEYVILPEELNSQPDNYVDSPRIIKPYRYSELITKPKSKATKKSRDLSTQAVEEHQQADILTGSKLEHSQPAASFANIKNIDHNNLPADFDLDYQLGSTTIPDIFTAEDNNLIPVWEQPLTNKKLLPGN